MRRARLHRIVTLAALLSAAAAGCSGTSLLMRNVASPVAAPPGSASSAPLSAPVATKSRSHKETLDALLKAPATEFFDPAHSVRLRIPDAPGWTLARILFTKTLFVLRYGEEPSAILGGGIVHIANERTPGACSAGFENRIRYWVDAFRVTRKHDPPRAMLFRGAVVDIDSFTAGTEGFFGHDEYIAAYAAFPAWWGTCVVIGLSVPVIGEPARAKALRERFINELLGTFDLVTPQPPTTLQ